MQYDNSNVGYAGPQAGNIARQGYPVYNDQLPALVGRPLQLLPGSPAPILNGTPAPLAGHPIENVAQLLHDHTNVLRQRLFAAQAQNGLAPEQVSEHGQVRANPLDLVRQTRATGSQNLAALLARFHGVGGRITKAEQLPYVPNPGPVGPIPTDGWQVL